MTRHGSALAAQLVGSEWVVESCGGADIIGERHASIQIAIDAALAGSGGCNRGCASIDGQAITFTALATTRMACPPAVMAQERKLLAALAATRSYRLDGTALTLRDASNAELVRLRQRAQGRAH